MNIFVKNRGNKSTVISFDNGYLYKYNDDINHCRVPRYDKLNFAKKLGLYDHIVRPGNTRTSMEVFNRLIESVNNGEHIDDFKQRINSIPAGIMLLNCIERTVIFPKVFFEREFNNLNKKTFDFITVKISVCISDFKKAFEFVNNNSQCLKQLALAAIIDKVTNIYNIPVNCLKITDCILTKASELVFTFDLKSI